MGLFAISSPHCAAPEILPDEIDHPMRKPWLVLVGIGRGECAAGWGRPALIRAAVIWRGGDTARDHDEANLPPARPTAHPQVGSSAPATVITSSSSWPWMHPRGAVYLARAQSRRRRALG